MDMNQNLFFHLCGETETCYAIYSSGVKYISVLAISAGICANVCLRWHFDTTWCQWCSASSNHFRCPDTIKNVCPMHFHSGGACVSLIYAPWPIKKKVWFIIMVQFPFSFSCHILSLNFFDYSILNCYFETTRIIRDNISRFL